MCEGIVGRLAWKSVGLRHCRLSQMQENHLKTVASYEQTRS